MNWSKWILLVDNPIQILLTIMESIDHSSRYKIGRLRNHGNRTHQREVLHNKLIPFAKFVRQWSQKSEQNLIGTHTEEKPSKISNIEVAILLSSYQNTLTKLQSWVNWRLLYRDETIRHASKVHSKKSKKLEFVNLKYVTYTQPIWVALKPSHFYINLMQPPGKTVASIDTTDVTF